MLISSFIRDFKQCNGVMLTPSVGLLRNPLELYDFDAGKTVARLKSLDEALPYELDGTTVQAIIESWDRIEFVRYGGRGSGSNMGTFKFGHAGGRGSGSDVKDLPARLNVRLKLNNKSPEAMLQEFRKLHANSASEYGVTVDEQGFVTQYIHGGATSVGIWGKKGEMVYHNHPSGGAFSDSDLLSTSMTPEKGIVASGKNGDYIFVKGGHFKSSAFMKAVKNATMSGKNYDDAVDKWLTRNQKKYGYKYVFQKA